MDEVLGYKVFNSDWTCRGFKFEVGKTYTQEGKLELCSNGFHFCRSANKCFDYYSFDPKNKVAIVKVIGELVGDVNDKEATNIIEIVEEVSWEKVLTIVNIGTGNSGDINSGDYNSGDINSGDYNSGDRNSGDYNSGDYNSGDYNSGDYNSGCFNTKTPDEILLFNNTYSRSLWESCHKPNFIFNVNINRWVYLNDMTDKEKESNPNFYVSGGYLKILSYKEAWMDAFLERDDDDLEKLKSLPNFDKNVFFEITGIDIDKF